MLKCALTSALIFLGAPISAAELLGSFTWSWPTEEPRFGGVSGIEVFAGGQEFLAISDHGFILNGTINRNGDQILSVAATINPLLTTQSKAVRGENRDAEGIAMSPNSQVFVSYEGNHRVARHDANGTKTVLLPRHETFSRFQRNSGLEALAMNEAGALVALPERSGNADRPFPLYQFSNGQWSIAHTIPRRGAFLPVGLDFGPDGTLYLLERHLSIFGFQSRVRSFQLDHADLGETTVLKTNPGQFDNLEGISIWRAPNGDAHMTLVSDDNYKIFQRTELVEYRLDNSE